MKKISIKIVCMVLVLTICCTFILAGCSNTEIEDNMYNNYTNLVENAKFYDGSKEANGFSLKGSEAEKKSIYIDLLSPTKFNTIKLSEKTKGVTQFDIFASNSSDNKSYKLIYSGDTIEDFRICFVGDVEYRYIKIEVSDSTSNYNVNDIKIYNNLNPNTKKRVTTYFLIDKIDTTDLNALDTVTDIILFSWMRFDKDGNVNIQVDNSNYTGFLDKAESEAKFAENLKKLKTKVAEIEQLQQRKINIFPCILMPLSDDINDANKYANLIMSDENRENTAQNVKAFIEKYGFDGVDFDYEYPYKKSEHKLFDKFLISVKNAIGQDKILSSALGDWNIDMSTEAIECLDQVQLMTYDLFDSHGYHGAFYPCMVNGLNNAVKKGIPIEKINLGIPFYSRPLSKSGYWGDYFRFFEDDIKALSSCNPNSKYINKVTFTACDFDGNVINELEYFNGYQMVADKTAFAIDTNVGGIMIWHINCDINYNKELSLFRAINQTLKTKEAQLVSNK